MYILATNHKRKGSTDPSATGCKLQRCNCNQRYTYYLKILSDEYSRPRMTIDVIFTPATRSANRRSGLGEEGSPIAVMRSQGLCLLLWGLGFSFSMPGRKHLILGTRLTTDEWRVTATHHTTPHQRGTERHTAQSYLIWLNWWSNQIFPMYLGCWRWARAFDGVALLRGISAWHSYEAVVFVVIGHACYALVEIYRQFGPDSRNLEHIHDRVSGSKLRTRDPRF